MLNSWETTLDPLHPKKHLHTLHTQLGKRSVYDSVSFCNRCGCCSYACPSYQSTQKEALSPRGRNQLVRLITEKKIKFLDHPALIKEVVCSCSFCGNCTTACAGKIPTAQHMLELRRALDLKLLPRLLYALLSWRETAPRCFAWVVRAAGLLRQAGLIKLLRGLQLTKIPCLTWINHADDILPAQTTPLSVWLKKTGYQAAAIPELIYLPSLEASFLNPQIGKDSLQWFNPKKTLVWPNRSAGLFSYLYGDLRQSRKSARKLLLIYEKTGSGHLPLVTDSAELYTFLHQYEQLFSNNTYWQKKAKTLVKNLRFVSDFFPKKGPRPAPDIRAKLDRSNLFDGESKIFTQAQKTLRTLFKKNFVQYGYNEMASPPGGYGFVQPQYSQVAFFAKAQETAQTQTDIVFLLSGLCALELNFYLKKYYPSSKAEHFTRLNG